MRKTYRVSAVIAAVALLLSVSPSPVFAEIVSPASSDASVDGPDGVATGATVEAVSPTLSAARGSSGASANCSPSADGNSATCITMGTTSSSRAVEAPSLSAARSKSPIPSWCLSQGVQNRYYVTRTAQCGIFSGTLTIRKTVNGQPTGPVTGTMNFLMYHYIYTLVDSPTWANQMTVSPTTVSGTAAGTQISGTAFCTGSCTAQSQSFPPQAPGAQQSAEGESYYKWTGSQGQVGTGYPQWTITFKAPTTNNTNSTTRSATGVRCDNALPGQSRAGCVIPLATPYIRYDGSSFVEFGQHVAGAQASGLPGGSTANPIHRITNSENITANRNKACAGRPSIPNRDCDEYPFASTREGASTGGGTARTQSWCQITLSGPASTGAKGYSVCMIDRRENQIAGSYMNSQLFVPYRVIDQDAFSVQIVR